MQTPDEAGSVPARDRVKSPWPESQTDSGGAFLTSNERIRVRAGKEKKEARLSKGFEHFGHPGMLIARFMRSAGGCGLSFHR